MTALNERRILCLWFPFLPTDRLARRHSEARDRGRPRVTVEKSGNALVVAAVDRSAKAMGLFRGQPLADARAQVPNIAVARADTAADAATLDALARQADRYTPLVGLDPPHGLFLDVTGCIHLFGDEDALLDDATARYAHLGYSLRGVIASNPAAAWALARHGGGGPVAPANEPDALAPLPVAALRLPEETTSVLARLGIKTVDQLLRQPRTPLVRRFGPLLARRIDQAEGREREPITPRLPVAPFLVERRFAEPVTEMTGTMAAVAGLADRLGQALAAQGKGARRFGLRLFHADGAIRELRVGASIPLADPARITALLRPRVDALSTRIEDDSGIDLMRLVADEIGDQTQHQTDFDGAATTFADLTVLIDTLSERLGIAATQRFVPVDTHQPARAAVRLPARDHVSAPSWPDRTHAGPPRRPLRLLTHPEPVETIAGVPDGPPSRFVWRRVAYHVAAAEGPERIAPDWWTSDAASRTADYFRVEDTEGRRFWLYRSGLYGDDAPPRWFMHGLFA